MWRVVVCKVSRTVVPNKLSLTKVNRKLITTKIKKKKKKIIKTNVIKFTSNYVWRRAHE